ncbi:MAG: hypothetical protein DRJ06_05335 [Candidatus Aminicenantes bacterium]|nr:MAG: hypothetical protein DRJ06_05335 [Candidatus Aminicenantes bacterium]
MVCITGRAVGQGAGCGTTNVTAKDAKDITKTIEIKNATEPDKLVFFIDKDNSHSFSSDDWVYSVKSDVVNIKNVELESYSTEESYYDYCGFGDISPPKELGFLVINKTFNYGKDLSEYRLAVRIKPKDEPGCHWERVAGAATVCNPGEMIAFYGREGAGLANPFKCSNSIACYTQHIKKGSCVQGFPHRRPRKQWALCCPVYEYE